MSYQGNSEVRVNGSIALACITPDARDLLDALMEHCPADIRQDGTSDRFLAWVHGSGLVQTECTIAELQQADRQWLQRMASVGTHRRDQVYGCAYWLVRYSGLVQPVEGDQ